MKKIFVTLLSVFSISAFAGMDKVVPGAIYNVNVTSQCRLETGGYRSVKNLILKTVVGGFTKEFVSSELATTCDLAKQLTSRDLNEILTVIDSINCQRIRVKRLNDHLVCYKDTMTFLFDDETLLNHDYITSQEVVVCP
jgi:hypothetical protein